MSKASHPTPEAIEAGFAERGFICTGEVATTLYLADVLAKPVLLEGPPGVGKTEIAKLSAAFHGAELVRLQCYEGLDEAKALYEWSYGKQMLYVQLLRDKTGELLPATADLRARWRPLRAHADEFFPPAISAAPAAAPGDHLGKAGRALIDEVDRADEEFEAFLLEVLSDHQVSIPELGTIRAKHPPRVVLTSNDTRDLSDALRRRCLYLYLDYPSFEDEMKIVESRVPGISVALAERLVRFAQSLRKADLRKAPGIAEVVDWALSLVAVGADSLSSAVLRRTLGVLLKNHEDVERVLHDPARFRA